MTNACTLSVDGLALSLRQKYAAGIRSLARRAGWQKAEIRGEAWLAAYDALANYDNSKGDLLARGWWFLLQAARKSGFVPSGARRADNAEELAQVAGGDDPAEIIAAVQQFERIVALGAADERPSRSERTARRYRAAARGAAERLLRDGAQGELF